MEVSAKSPVTTVKPGDRVRVRQETWVVSGVDPHGPCTLLTLSAASSGQHPRSAHVLTPFDDVEREEWGEVPASVTLRRWRRACRALLAADGPAGSLRTAAAARMSLLPYQLEPALALVRGHGTRVLIADEVGLGKTVQAALAIAELRASGSVRRVLILCPSGLRDQWVGECRERFEMDVSVVDQLAVRRLQAELPPGLNPWSLQPCVVASVDYVKRREVLPAALAAPWDLVMVDEAHGVAGPSDRHDAVSALCRRATYVVLLTATPHNGDEEGFSSLCGLGALDDPLLVFRRLRTDTGSRPARRVHIVRVRTSAAEDAMHAALRDLGSAMRLECRQTDRQAWLLLSLLHKRACSSAFALAESAQRRLDALTGDDPDAHQLVLPLDSGDLDSADDPPMWSQPALRDGPLERSLLRALVSAARAAETSDSKLRCLGRLLRRLREPAIVFTEYRDTLLHIQRRMAPHAVVVHGGMSADERRHSLRMFAHTGLLLATDAAGEGLNLQHASRTVINLELPWNPMRLEQRAGRVDRIGQTRRVHAFHLVSDGSGEGRLLERLSLRIARAGSVVGAPNPLGGAPRWTEATSARLVMGGRPGDDDEGRECSGRAEPSIPLASFEEDGSRECARLAAQRALLAPRSSTPEPGPARVARPLAAWTRRRRSRVALQGRMLALFRTTLDDEAGHQLATHVTALMVPEGHATAGEHLARLRVPHTEARAVWLAESIAHVLRAAATRQRRSEAVLAALRSPTPMHQPGLFDRRAVHEHRADVAERAAAVAAAEECAARADAARRVAMGPTRLMLLLRPGGRRRLR